MVHEISGVPLFYIVKGNLSSQQVEEVKTVLSITPCRAVFISNILDTDLAWSLGDQVIRADEEPTALILAKKWATELGRPMLVIGNAELLDAVFEDGHREAVATHA